MKFFVLFLLIGCGRDVFQQKYNQASTETEDDDTGSSGDGVSVDGAGDDGAGDGMGDEPTGPGDSETDNDPPAPPATVDCSTTIICHKDKNTLCVGNEHAVAAHLDHGDRYGRCQEDEPVEAYQL